MHASFAPDGRWFVFDDAGRTLAKGFKARIYALNWIARQEEASCPRQG